MRHGLQRARAGVDRPGGGGGGDEFEDGFEDDYDDDGF